MKNALLLVIGLMIAGCGNSHNEDGIKKTIDKDVWKISRNTANNAQHRYQLMENFPIEGGPLITEEPEHAAVSEIEYAQEGIYYVYEPRAGFTGTDNVEITNNISNGAKIVAQTILKLRIEVNE